MKPQNQAKTRKWLLLNSKQPEEGEFSQKELIEILKKDDERVNKKTLVRSTDTLVKEWQNIAQTEELESLRELLYKDTDQQIWPNPPEIEKRSGVLLSFLFVGLGQLYLGQAAKGGIIMAFQLIVGIILTTGLLCIPIWIIGMIDTYQLQKKLSNGQPIKKWDFF